MKKVLCAMAAALLVGCTLEDSNHEQWKSYSASGLAQRGFFVTPRGEGMYMDTRNGDWSAEVSMDSATRSYEIKNAELTTGLVEIGAGARDYVSPYENRLIEDLSLTAVVDLSVSKSVNVNYLTTLASDLIWHNIRHGIRYQEAKQKANTTVLKLLHLPEDLIDFEQYSLYGKGEGDAMLAAVSIVVEKYMLEYSMSTAWEGFDIDTATGEFVNSSVLRRLAGYANAIVRGDGGDSLRKAIEAKAPKGRVGNFEKYLSQLFSAYLDNPKCDASSQGEMLESHFNYRHRVLVCSDSTWRFATKDDFEEVDIFNPNVEYGVLEDARDGRKYRTVEIGKYTWMAENLRYADSAATKNLKGQTWCYDDDESNCEKFGRLYSWTAMMDAPAVYLDSIFHKESERGICPEGWHVPYYEFSNLPSDTTLFSAYMARRYNETGFSMVPAGYAYHETIGYDDEGYTIYGDKMHYDMMGSAGYLWTNSQESGSGARIYYFENQEESYYSRVSSSPVGKQEAYYVRCVQDYEPETY